MVGARSFDSAIDLIKQVNAAMKSFSTCERVAVWRVAFSTASKSAITGQSSALKSQPGENSSSYAFSPRFNLISE